MTKFVYLPRILEPTLFERIRPRQYSECDSVATIFRNGWQRFSGTAGNYFPDSVAVIFRNRWHLCPGIRSAGVLHHSDRGSQYASNEYQERLKKYQMIGSMSRKGCCYDNACIESFHSVIKRELIHLEKFKTRSRAKREIWEYIERWYNRRRIHSSIDYKTPVQFQAMYENSLLKSAG